MNPSSLPQKFFMSGSAALLGLLMTAATAAPLNGSTTGPVATPPASSAGTFPGQTHLMPAASVSSQPPTSSEEDIRDIRRPRHLPTRWPWAAAAAGIIALTGGLLWRWLRHGKFFKMQPHEIALQHLAEARRLMNPDQAREYCFEVSGIVRRYIEERFRLQAPQLTTEEFIRELVEAGEGPLATHRNLLGDFLQHCDLAKFAGWRYCRPDLEAMHASAETFVHQTVLTDADADRHRTGTVPPKTNDPSDSASPPDLLHARTA
jgi:hypothetical protein